MLLRRDEGTALGKRWSSDEGVADTSRDLAIQDLHPSQGVQIPDAHESGNMLLAGKLNDMYGGETISFCLCSPGT